MLGGDKNVKAWKWLVGVIVFVCSIMLANGQTDIDITPEAPPGISDALKKIAGWALWIFVLIGLVSVVYGVFRLYSGDRRAGIMYIVGGVVVVAVAYNINSIVSSLVSP